MADHTPLLTGEVAEEMFGLVWDDGTEAGTMVFADQATLDYIHYVEWTMPDPVLVSRITVQAAGDECTGDRRTFDSSRSTTMHPTKDFSMRACRCLTAMSSIAKCWLHSAC